MNLLLINPPNKNTIEANLPKYVDDNRGNIPPIGLLYLAAMVQQKTRWNIAVCDMAAGDELVMAKPDIVGITATTFTLLDALDTAQQVKQKWPDAKVILGGIHPTIYPMETVNLPWVDYVVTGEGEEVLPGLLNEIVKGTAPKITRGNPPDIEKLPIPARDLIRQTRYYSSLGSSKYLATMFTSRGCPYQCLFCHRMTMGKTFRARAAAQVVNEFQDIAGAGIHEVLIYDDTFTVNRQRVVDVCNELIDLRLGITFDIRARVDNVDKELLHLLKLAGCNRIHYGVEASNDRILERLRKGITIKQVRQAFKLTKDTGIETLAYFIIGSPGETVEDILHTIDFAKELKPDYCHFAVMTPYPATPLYNEGLREGLYNDYWLEFAKHPRPDFVAPYWPEIDREILRVLLNKAYSSFYWRLGKVTIELMKTKSIRQLAKKSRSAIKMLVKGR